MPDGTPGDRPALATLAQEAVDLAKEAVYLAVGFGLLGMNRAQARRRELQAQWQRELLRQQQGQLRERLADLSSPALEARLHELMADERVQALRAEVLRQAQQLDGLVDEAVQLVEASLEPLQERLPAPARDLARLAASGTRQLGARLQELIGRAA
ncbi:MAG TPA: hypothetical protein VKV36_12090 [Acidimicrobiales bacterium]|nr:hypothetical protein [Acidimicrobiales bacterium]